VTLVDDGALTASTLQHTTELLARQEIDVRRVLVCTASTTALGRLRRSQHVDCVVVMPSSSSDILQLRDCMPLLPYSGVPVSGLTPVTDGQSILHKRLQARLGNTQKWTARAANDAGTRAISIACTETLRHLLRHLGREAVVRDLRNLGDGVSIPLRHDRQQVEANTPLTAFL
jgi:hypothetical protein